MSQDEELEPPTIYRLNALMAVGYEIDTTTSQKVSDAIWLDHPAKKRAKEPTLIVYNDGLVVGDSAKDPNRKQLRLNPEHIEEFNQFVRTVPQPNAWERSQKTLVNIFAWGVMLMLWTIAYLAISLVINMFRG